MKKDGVCFVVFKLIEQGCLGSEDSRSISFILETILSYPAHWSYCSVDMDGEKFWEPWERIITADSFDYAANRSFSSLVRTGVKIKKPITSDVSAYNYIGNRPYL